MCLWCIFITALCNTAFYDFLIFSLCIVNNYAFLSYCSFYDVLCYTYVYFLLVFNDCLIV